MGWALKPILPAGATFGGELVYTTTDLEIEDTFRKYVESVNLQTNDQYVNKHTGFETKKYKRNDADKLSFDITLSGNIPHWLEDGLYALAEAMNGAGMILQFKDTWVNGTDLEPITYECRWQNATDFVDNSTILSGGTMQLLGFNISDAIIVQEYQKTIDIPGSDLQWDLEIDTGVGIIERQRVI